MNDTHDSMKLRYHQMLMSRTPLERLKMGFSMYDTAKQIVQSSIRNQNPKISRREMRKETFLRFYGKDFKLDFRDKILKFLE